MLIFFERFLAKKYVGKKRFSLEGGDSLIPMLDTIIEVAGNQKVESVVLGMAHRGRLNVLVNVMEKPASQIFAEFEENYNPDTLDYRDVKYHLGYSSTKKTTSGNEVHLSLMFNPSHLEAVSPVVAGSVRARQDIANDQKREKVLGIMIHGDAAFSGQGVVAETLNLMNLEGFDTGGTIHIVVDNQIGFTTLPEESRSTLYATDLAKGFQVPIIHVNGDDPIAVYRTVMLAMEYRKTFKKDIIIDLVCYRRFGHNEMDEPAFTQGKTYQVIKKFPRLPEIFQKQLNEHKDINNDDLENIKKRTTEALESSFKQAHEKNIQMVVDTMHGAWANFSLEPLNTEPETKLLKKQMNTVTDALTQIPAKFTAHPKLITLYENRRRMNKGDILIDWGFAEALAFASLLMSNVRIRLCGQDAQRGTFSHRHSMLVDINTGEKYAPLNHLSSNQGKYEVINSPLSEFSVLGFEYGYSLSSPNDLILWEAQFGDFANSAQIIFDQFLSSSEAKWFRLSGLVVLLPHGFEGQGPEHSSARLERYLQLCAQENIQVCNLTTAAQYFHLLRRQVLRKYRKPLIIMTPKSLLRLTEAASSIDDLTKGEFRRVIFDKSTSQKKKITRLLLCSGKVYFDISNGRAESKKKNIAIARVEQLYPFPVDQISEIIKSYPALKEVYWVQEEPENMGSYSFISPEILAILPESIKFKCISRPASASPAAGLASIHASEQKELVTQSLAD